MTELAPTLEPPEELVGFIPQRLRCRHVAAGLDIRPRQAKHLMENDTITCFQAGYNRWRETTPRYLIEFAIRMERDIDWEAIIDEDLAN